MYNKISTYNVKDYLSFLLFQLKNKIAALMNKKLINKHSNSFFSKQQQANNKTPKKIQYNL